MSQNKEIEITDLKELENVMKNLDIDDEDDILVSVDLVPKEGD